MRTEPNKEEPKSRWMWTDAVKIILVLGVLGLSIYSNRLVSSSAPGITSTAYSEALLKVTPTRTEIPSTALYQVAVSSSPTAEEIHPTVTPSVSDYRTILLLERSTDLIVAYIDKLEAGQIASDDTSTRQLYLGAFPIAIDAYNKTIPSAIMVHAWNNVQIAASAYATVYPILQQGRLISANDLFRLKSYRQFLVNYQTTEEAHLINNGNSQDYFTAEQQAVDQLLQKDYGGTPLPPLVP
jgi:hypothetical protein